MFIGNGKKKGSSQSIERNCKGNAVYDLNVQNDIKYVYSVRSVKRVVKTDVREGIRDPRDRPSYSTEHPVGLVAIPSGGWS